MNDDRCDLLCLDLPHAERIRTTLPDLEALASRAALGRALADPTRLAVAAALLAGDELCVCDMAWVVGTAQNLASHHLRALRSAGLVTSRRDGKLVMYRLTPVGGELVRAVLGPAVVEEV
ncbi:metalloregulator ArsR/SmtB family transcription factor [Actinomycetospora lutea]|uniref:ArsR/SmtB family transcription factor n=1 Tax=Actinomycetospora lutea TaxID=663604 RepID=UPI002365EA31|nr:metalloregulator ArsR/SmtB family transcription factor [Actinomycetospora lutea]MDD7940351.1 metalloregulator ArsR/SmtB family transcription factor [Actinomycetospora lutea]